MDRLEAMSTLLAVVEAGSLSGASRRLRTPLATVSRRIIDLERHLKTQLLNRSTRRLTLTDAGEGYLQACRRILEDVEEAERVASGEYRAPKGELTITVSPVFGRRHVIPASAAFLKVYPEIALQLRLTEDVINLLEEHIDLGIRIGPLVHGSLVARRIGSIRHVVCASPEYLQIHGHPETPADLSSHDCIFSTSLAPGAHWNFPIGDSMTTAPVKSRLRVDTAEAVLDAGLAGAGIVRLFSYQIAEAVKEGRLKLLLETFEPPPLPVNIFYVGGGLLPSKARAFIDFAVPVLKERLDADLS